MVLALIRSDRIWGIARAIAMTALIRTNWSRRRPAPRRAPGCGLGRWRDGYFQASPRIQSSTPLWLPRSRVLRADRAADPSLRWVRADVGTGALVLWVWPVAQERCASWPLSWPAAAENQEVVD